MERFAIRGQICYSENQKTIRTIEHGYVVCEDGKSIGVFETLPATGEKTAEKIFHGHARENGICRGIEPFAQTADPG